MALELETKDEQIKELSWYFIYHHRHGSHWYPQQGLQSLSKLPQSYKFEINLFSC